MIQTSSTQRVPASQLSQGPSLAHSPSLSYHVRYKLHLVLGAIIETVLMKVTILVNRSGEAQALGEVSVRIPAPMLRKVPLTLSFIVGVITSCLNNFFADRQAFGGNGEAREGCLGVTLVPSFDLSVPDPSALHHCGCSHLFCF